MGTFNSTGSGGSWTDNSTWAEDGQPAADGTDYVIITSGDVVTLPANTGTGAISIQGEITGNGHTLTLAGSGDSPLMNFDGTITSSSVLNLTITADENNTIDCLGTGTFNNVIINNSGYTTTLSHTLTCASLTITAGELDTGADKALTVTGTTTVSNGTLTLNGSTCIFNTGATAGGLITDHTSAVVVADADSTCTFGSIALHSSGCDVRLAGTNTINKYLASTDIIIHAMAGTFDAASAFTVTTPDAKGFAVQDTSVTLTITPASSIAYKLEDTLNVAALTISANASLTTLDGSSSRGLTVTGATDVTGTLTCNASTVSLGSGKSDDYALTGGGTVNFGTGTNTVGAVNTTSASGITKTSGTITFDTTKTGGQSIGPNVINNNTHYNFGTSTVNFDLSGGSGSLFAIEQHLGSSKTFTITAATVNYKSNGRIYQNNTDTNIFKIIGDLVIDASKTLTTYFDNADDFGSKLEVTGDVTLNGTLNAYSASNPKPMDFGSLTIASGGEYIATSGTTTLTAQHAVSGMGFKNQGTFTHNNGLVKFTESVESFVYCQESNFYDLEVDLDSNTDEFRWLESGVGLTVYNNLTITSGRFKFNTSGDPITVHGLTNIIDGQFGLNSPSGVHTFNGLVTIKAGTWYTSSGTNNFNSGVRNLGTFISDDTLTIGGTGGILEGNLDDANVNVNLDACLHFDGNGDYIDLGDLTVLDGEGSFTIASWVNFDSDSGDDQRFLWKAGSFGIGYFSGQLRGYIYYSGGDTNAQVSHSVKGEGWKHVAMTYDGTTVRLFINGAEAATASVSSKTLANSGNNLRLGGSGSSNEYLKGNMADVRLYSSVLDPDTEIPVLASRIGIDNAVVQSTDTRVGHWMLTVKDSTSTGDAISGSDETDNEIDMSEYRPFTNGDYILIDDEIIGPLSAVGDSGNDVAIPDGDTGRGMFGTTKAAHSAGVPIYIANMDDLSTNSNLPTLVGDLTTPSGDLDFNQFYVNVHDPYDGSDEATRTQTDGSFTITQGKVEGLSLSSVDFDGSADYIDVNNDLEAPHQGSFTWSAWIKLDDGIRGSSNDILASLDGGSGTIFRVDSAGKLSAYYIAQDGTSEYATSADVLFANGQTPWHHVVYVNDDTANQMYLYLDGVPVTLSTSSGQTGDLSDITNANYRNDNHFSIGAKNHNTTVSNFFLGNIRDVKLFDYALSTDQVSSMYSGSYNVTPIYWWKLDEGHSTAALNNAVDAFKDSGTGTDVDIQGVSLVDASCVNGTLDLDGSLTIAANGTLSAPRGTLDCKRDFHSSGTYTHNNGTALLGPASGSATIQNGGSPSEPVFYNLQARRVVVYNNVTVESRLDAGHGDHYCYFYSPTTVTMGTTTSQGTFDIDSALVWFHNAKLYGASSLYPAIVDATTDLKFDSTTTVYFKWIDYQGALTTEGTGHDIQLDGDCEFDAVTVSSGDELDLNGQRAVFSGAFVLAGALDWASSMAIFNSTVDLAGKFPTSNAATTIIHDAGSASDWTSLYSDGTFFTRGAATNVKGYQWKSGTASYVTDKIIVGGTLDLDDDDKDIQTGDLTIPTGGTVTAGGQELTIEGDFTTSGGLLGASCYNFDSSSDYYAYTGSIDFRSGSARDYTVEFWMKPDAISGTQRLIDSTDKFLIYLTGSGAIIFQPNYNTGITTSAVITAGKWHHVACTWDTSEDMASIYVDGKLMVQGTDSTSDTTGAAIIYLGRRDNGAAEYDGYLDEVRLWTDLRTEAEIRTDMFQGGTLDDSGALFARWSLDEGATASSADTSSNSNTLTVVAGGWADGGTFTYGTSTLDMTGADGKIYYAQNHDVGSLESYSFYNLKVAPSGGTTTMVKTNTGDYKIFNNLHFKGGTFAQSGYAIARLHGTVTAEVGAAISIPYLSYWHSGASVPSATFQYFISATDVTLGGDCTFTGYLRTGSDKITTGAYSHSVRSLTIDGNGTMDLSNSTITMTGTTSSTSFADPNSTIISGNTTIIGHASKTYWLSPAAAGHEIVGDVSNLLGSAGNDLTIIGSVTNCTGVGFRQWHHTLDTQQLLDADSAGDDDLRLSKPALDNSHELQTG